MKIGRIFTADKSHGQSLKP